MLIASLVAFGFVFLVFLGIACAAKLAGPVSLSVYALSIAIILGLMLGSYLIIYGLVVLNGGSLIDFATLLGSASGTLAAKAMYVQGIVWEEVVKAVVLILFLRSVTVPARSYGTYLLPGYIFGMMEGALTLWIQLYVLNLDKEFNEPLPSFANIAFGIFCSVLGHGLVMTGYYFSNRMFSSSFWRFSLGFVGATTLHLLYNARIVQLLDVSPFDGTSSIPVYLMASIVPLVTLLAIMRSANSGAMGRTGLAGGVNA